MKTIYRHFGSIIIILLTVMLIVGILGLNAKELPSIYQKTSGNYNKDKNFDVYLYQTKIGNYKEYPQRSYGHGEGITLKLEYKSGPDNNSDCKTIEARKLGFLFVLLLHKNKIILYTIILCIILCAPQNVFGAAITYPVICLYAIALMIVGIIGIKVHVMGISSFISNFPDAPSGIILIPIAHILALIAGGIYIAAIIAGIFILRCKRWAIVLGIIIQSVFALLLPFLMGFKLKPVGWRITVLDLYLYFGIYLFTIIITIWFFTRPETKGWFLKNKNRLRNQSTCPSSAASRLCHLRNK